MFGRSSGRNVRCAGVAALGATLILSTLACVTSRNSCASPETGLIFHAVRSSAGAAMTSAEFRIGADALVYAQGEQRCASLTAVDAASVRAVLSAQQLVTILGDISSKKYQEQHADMPHVVLEIGSGPVFIPAHLLTEGELRELLRPVDDLFRKRFGRRYRLPLLPTTEEGEDLKRLWAVSRSVGG